MYQLLGFPTAVDDLRPFEQRRKLNGFGPDRNVSFGGHETQQANSAVSCSLVRRVQSFLESQQAKFNGLAQARPPAPAAHSVGDISGRLSAYGGLSVYAHGSQDVHVVVVLRGPDRAWAEGSGELEIEVGGVNVVQTVDEIARVEGRLDRLALG